MNEKDPQSLLEVLKSLSPWLTTIFLSCWGGVVNYIATLRKKGRTKINWLELSFDLVVSSFVGILTHILCLWANMDALISAALIAVSGHMGTRAMAGFERFRNRIFNFEDSTNDSQ